MAAFPKDADGGAAFPRTGGESGREWVCPQDGMSLRDWFAGQACHALTFGQTFEHAELAPERFAKLAYRIADAMLEARER
jgi:hypothetical protein